MEKNAFQSQLTDSLNQFKSNVAIEYKGRRPTYKDLDEKAAVISNWIIEKGVKKETFIGILAADRVEYISAIIGILKAGCAFVPMDPDNPDNRLAQMVEILDLKIVFIDDAYREFAAADLMKERQTQFVVLNRLDRNKKTPGFTSTSPGEYSPEDKVYVYLTSGTTGEPKAIVGKSKSLLNYCRWELQTFGINEKLRLSQFATTSDAFLKEIFVTFLSGGTLCIPADLREILYPGALIDWVENNDINLIHCVPHVFRILASDALTGNNFKNLKYLVLSGERIYPQDLRNWYDNIGERVQLVNLYGTTETTILNTCYFIKKTDMDRQRIPVGKPIKGNQVMILDENMNICPRNIAGEICIRTPFRTFGYYNDPELNQKKFTRNPFNDNPNDLIFKTGDKGILLPDGNIDLLGRIDRQVKIRGHRIELEEIESTLRTHPGISETVVIKKQISVQNELLAAYFTIKEGAASRDGAMVDDLKEYLSQRLPDYMVPSRMIAVEKIPRKSNRKIEYNLLPDPFAEDEIPRVPPGDEVECKLVEFWSHILKLERIGVNNNFFRLGGSSLNVMSLSYKIRKEFDLQVSLGDIFNNPTIRKQAALIKGSGEYTRYTSIESVEKREYYALSYSQKSIYIAYQLNKHSLSYNMSRAVLLEGTLHMEKLNMAFSQLIRRHESLRTSFETVNREPVQRIHEQVEFKIEYDEAAVEDGHGLIKDFIRPFDLTKAPLLRVGSIKMANMKHLLMVDMYHIILDALSMAIFVKELTVLYNGEELSLLKIQYKDFSRWQNRMFQSGNMEKEKAHWLSRFKDGDIPVLNMPLDYPRPSLRNIDEGDSLDFTFDKELCDKLYRVVNETGATLFIVLLAAYKILLSKYTKQENIIVGTILTGRIHGDLENVIGLFINTLPIKSCPQRHKIFKQFLEEVKESVLNTYENQDYPFDELVSELGIKGDPTRNPLVETVLSFIPPNDEAVIELKNPGLKFKPYINKAEFAKFDLQFMVTQMNETIGILLRYSTQLFKPSTIRKIAKHYIEVLEQVVDNIAVKLKDITLSHDFLAVTSSVHEDDNSDFIL